MERDWANLEAAALNLILDKLRERIDHVWFSVVCKNWCSVAKLNHRNQQFRTNVLPMIMIPIETSLYGIPGNRVYSPSSLSLSLSLISNKKICGSSHGWLAMVEDGQHVITLINPFKKVDPIIVLPPLNPPLEEFDENSVNKVVLSVDPLTNPNDYMVAAILNDHSCFAIIRAGQQNWTHVEEDDWDCYYTDITFYKGLAYVACRMNNIVSFNLHYLDEPSGGERIVPKKIYEDNYDLTSLLSDRGYLLKSLEGDLWIVRRILDIQHKLEADVFYRGTVIERFDVYKLQLDAQNGEVLQTLKLENLGDNVLFVGDCDSTAVSSSYFSDCLQKDSIYYTNDFDDGTPSTCPQDPFDLRVYNVKEGRFIQPFPFNPLSPTFWILPPFQF